MEQFRRNAKACPEEVIWTIGKSGDTVDAEILEECFNKCTEWHRTRFPNVIFIDAGLHLDEPDAAPHVHQRQVWFVAHDKSGEEYLRVHQGDALKEMNIDKPNPAKKESRNNNAKVTYTAICREKMIEIAEAHGIEIEREPDEKSKSGLSLLEYKVRTTKEKLAEAEEQLDKLKKANDDFVRELEPTPTKIVKKFGGEKEVPKTDEELKRDKEVLAAQAVLRDKDKIAEDKIIVQQELKLVRQEREELQNDREEFEKYVADREAEHNQKTATIHEGYKRQLAAQEDKHEKETAGLRAENHTLKDKIKQLLMEKARFLATVAIRARTALERKRRENGEVTPNGYDVDAQMRAIHQLYHNDEPPLSPK